ncbi:hypothetical protein ACFPM7_24585 [Actinokineospora guangxiensis]|uniref:Uncharacterized protein n=1 Tax=Actinokineospora guangxiensis TaxID=1490288 RepID=A0ABW0ES47_9PSEU
MKMLFSFPTAVRVAFWMLLVGFTAGLLVGYQATARADEDAPGDPRSIGVVLCFDRSRTCTPTSFSS